MNGFSFRRASMSSVGDGPMASANSPQPTAMLETSVYSSAWRLEMRKVVEICADTCGIGRIGAARRPTGYTRRATER